jgi:hypothetical protein
MWHLSSEVSWRLQAGILPGKEDIKDAFVDAKLTKKGINVFGFFFFLPSKIWKKPRD